VTLREGIVQPVIEWLQILSSHVPDANIVLVGTHSMTPEGKGKPGLFKDGAYIFRVCETRERGGAQSCR